MRLSRVMLPLVMLLVVGSAVYSAATGNAIGADYHFNTVGRVANAIAAAIAVGYGLWTWRKMRELDRRIAARKADR